VFSVVIPTKRRASSDLLVTTDETATSES